MKLNYFLIWAIQLFFVGLIGTLSTQNNVIFMLLTIEVMILASNLVIIVSSFFFFDLTGQIFSIFILSIAAAESAVGLSLLILFFRLRGTIAYPFINLIKG